MFCRNKTSSLENLQLNPFAKTYIIYRQTKTGRVRKTTLKETEDDCSFQYFRGFIFSYLCKSCPLNQIIEFPHSSLLWETLNIFEEILCLCLKEPSIICVSERMSPEGADVDPQHLWSVDHLSQGPHESTVDSHQLLCVHLVSLIKHHSNLVILAPEWLNSLWKLIWYIQLMGIKKQDDAVDPLSKPLENLAEVIA